ncbi:relaxase/mobilization nuclease domain-containing protein [Lactococcus formosensis]|uniref:relaxase/mobilization nuclease domain-containing protein n=1 Tax=Lactococcus formosensis TaxID=1281486 RepID=UPI00311AF913
MVVVPFPKQIKSEKALKSAVKYILNPQKTEEQILTSGYHIGNLNYADVEMGYTRLLARKMVGRQNKQVLAHHLVQSFRPEDGLSAEEIHQIGKEWVEQLTGGKHEYIIATHIDKDHIHNHIIFNATSNVDFKNFRWQKNTLQVARELSDKISLQHGAILEKSLPYQKSYHSYQKYLAKNPVRPELKSRLNFLLKHSLSLEDFKQKALALNVVIDFSGMYTTYTLKDFEQKRPVRDSSLISKKDQAKMDAHPEKRIFSKENIEKQCLQNQNKNIKAFSKNEIYSEYQKQQAWYKENNNIKLVLEEWQVDQEVDTGIYIFVQAGHREGTIKIPHTAVDRNEDGKLEIHLNSYSKFTFMDAKYPAESKILWGHQIISQLSHETDNVPIYNSKAMNNVHNLFDAMNLLARHGVSGRESFNHLGEDFIAEMREIEASLEKLDNLIQEKSDHVKFNTHDKVQVEQLKNLQTERKELQEAYSKITDDLELYDNIQNFSQVQDKERTEERKVTPHAKR